MAHWVTCTNCHRVLLAEHGPTCPECVKLLASLPADEVIYDAGPAQQPTPTPRPVRRKRQVAEPVDDTERVRGCCP